jgi:hypothetical protein
MSDENLDEINRHLVEFCWRHGTPLLQFILVSRQATDGSGCFASGSDSPRLATDSAANWADRCLGGNS